DRNLVKEVDKVALKSLLGDDRQSLPLMVQQLNDPLVRGEQLNHCDEDFVQTVIERTRTPQTGAQVAQPGERVDLDREQLLGPTARRYVSRDLGGPHDHAVRVPDRRKRERNRHQSAILGFADRFKGRDTLAGADAPQELKLFAMQLLRNDLQDGSSE